MLDMLRLVYKIIFYINNKTIRGNKKNLERKRDMVLTLRILGVVLIIVGLVFMKTDNEKKVGYISFILSAVAFIISLFPGKHMQVTPDKPEPTPYTTESTNIPENTSPPEETSQSSDGDGAPIFTGDEWTGSLGEGDSESIEYKAEKSGNYRFDFIIQDVEREYVFYINDVNGDRVTSASSSDEGVTQELEAGHVYELEVEQVNGDGEYRVRICSPNEKMTVSDNIIDGQISYTDQNNEYIYVAPQSGTYRFDFEINDVETEYYFNIRDSKNEQILNSNSSDGGAPVNLVQNETYTFNVGQETGMPHYTIKIGIPEAVKNISKNKFSGKIKFEDQEDNYIYVAPRSGIYRMDFTINDVNKEYTVYVKDNKNEQIKVASSGEEGCTVELKKGIHYKIIVEQYSGICDYKVKINIPNKIISTQKNLISGEIKYTDQKNVYYYTVNKTGDYLFEFETSNAESEYNITLYKWNNEKILERGASDKSAEVRLEKNQKYKLHIDQERGFEHYIIKISPM